MKVFAENKKAYANYQILEKFEAGIVLIGQEVKSIRDGRINLSGSYVVPRGLSSHGLPEFFLVGASVPPYQPKNAPADYTPERSRKLLLQKSEIRYLIGKTQQKGLTLIPLKVYTKKAKIKIEFGLAKGFKYADKRNLIRKREAERDIERALKRSG